MNNIMHKKAVKITVFLLVIQMLFGLNTIRIFAQEPLNVFGESYSGVMPDGGDVQANYEAAQALVDRQNQMLEDIGQPQADLAAAAPEPTGTPLPEDMEIMMGPVIHTHVRQTTPNGYVETCVDSDGWTKIETITSYVEEVPDPSQPDMKKISTVTTVTQTSWSTEDNEYNILVSKWIHSELNERGTEYLSTGGSREKDNFTWENKFYNESGVLYSHTLYGHTREIRYDSQGRVVEKTDVWWNGPNKEIMHGTYGFYFYNATTGHISTCGVVEWFSNGDMCEWTYDDRDGDGILDWLTYSHNGIIVSSGPFV